MVPGRRRSRGCRILLEAFFTVSSGTELPPAQLCIAIVLHSHSNVTEHETRAVYRKVFFSYGQHGRYFFWGLVTV